MDDSKAPTFDDFLTHGGKVNLLMTRFKGIPAHAERKETTVVKIPTFDNPFAGAHMGTDPLGMDDDRVHVWYESDGGQIIKDVTDEYEAWLKTQPQIKRVIFEWIEEPKVSDEKAE